mmetsp:Transcript_8667/g.12592  ORF Transcript_8667/g.12592 Transcript_8667/m.12592 type:complete len:107 (+) Transcript_8667:168-488(+)
MKGKENRKPHHSQISEGAKKNAKTSTNVLTKNPTNAHANPQTTKNVHIIPPDTHFTADSIRTTNFPMWGYSYAAYTLWANTVTDVETGAQLEYRHLTKGKNKHIWD